MARLWKSLKKTQNDSSDSNNAKLTVSRTLNSSSSNNNILNRFNTNNVSSSSSSSYQLQLESLTTISTHKNSYNPINCNNRHNYIPFIKSSIDDPESIKFNRILSSLPLDESLEVILSIMENVCYLSDIIEFMDLNCLSSPNEPTIHADLDSHEEISTRLQQFHEVVPVSSPHLIPQSNGSIARIKSRQGGTGGGAGPIAKPQTSFTSSPLSPTNSTQHSSSQNNITSSSNQQQDKQQFQLQQQLYKQQKSSTSKSTTTITQLLIRLLSSSTSSDNRTEKPIIIKLNEKSGYFELTIGSIPGSIDQYSKKFQKLVDFIDINHQQLQNQTQNQLQLKYWLILDYWNVKLVGLRLNGKLRKLFGILLRCCEKLSFFQIGDSKDFYGFEVDPRVGAGQVSQAPSWFSKIVELETCDLDDIPIADFQKMSGSLEKWSIVINHPLQLVHSNFSFNSPSQAHGQNSSGRRGNGGANALETQFQFATMMMAASRLSEFCLRIEVFEQNPELDQGLSDLIIKYFRHYHSRSGSNSGSGSHSHSHSGQSNSISNHQKVFRIKLVDCFQQKRSWSIKQFISNFGRLIKVFSSNSNLTDNAGHNRLVKFEIYGFKVIDRDCEVLIFDWCVGLDAADVSFDFDFDPNAVDSGYLGYGPSSRNNSVVTANTTTSMNSGRPTMNMKKPFNYQNHTLQKIHLTNLKKIPILQFSSFAQIKFIQLTSIKLASSTLENLLFCLKLETLILEDVFFVFGNSGRSGGKFIVELPQNLKRFELIRLSRTVLSCPLFKLCDSNRSDVGRRSAGKAVSVASVAGRGLRKARFDIGCSISQKFVDDLTNCSSGGNSLNELELRFINDSFSRDKSWNHLKNVQSLKIIDSIRVKKFDCGLLPGCGSSSGGSVKVKGKSKDDFSDDDNDADGPMLTKLVLQSYPEKFLGCLPYSLKFLELYLERLQKKLDNSSSMNNGSDHDDAGKFKFGNSNAAKSLLSFSKSYSKLLKSSKSKSDPGFNISSPHTHHSELRHQPSHPQLQPQTSALSAHLNKLLRRTHLQSLKLNLIGPNVNLIGFKWGSIQDVQIIIKVEKISLSEGLNEDFLYREQKDDDLRNGKGETGWLRSNSVVSGFNTRASGRFGSVGSECGGGAEGYDELTTSAAQLGLNEDEQFKLKIDGLPKQFHRFVVFSERTVILEVHGGDHHHGHGHRCKTSDDGVGLGDGHNENGLDGLKYILGVSEYNFRFV
ncbi:unnamed protein product [Ambrosiozyma monospora]|uniref:Unnamed protein product n=1 Tax=Ambrosiozyma monospora TaxID=43982 RepID=A0A9W7DEG4_AMBMO|nr:unnamed protein product [Ambrosiozyma monospora]